MKLSYLFVLATSLLLNYASAQLSFVRYDSIPVTITGDTLKNPWAGGLNSPQFSQIDLNGDGIKDLFAFERNWNGKVRTYINRGTPNLADYIYAPEYQSKFPPMRNWTLLVDYNCDGKEDIFTQTTAGIAVYRNDYDAVNGLSFTLVSPLINTASFSGNVNLYVSSIDIPAITDIDNDGDLDILTFGISGSHVEYHKNLSMENYGVCDSLVFELKNTCWGYFSENALNNNVTINDTCTGNVASPEGAAHSGSTLLALDLFGNGVKDLVLGDVAANNMVMLTNGGTTTNSGMTAFDSSFPSNTVPVDLTIFPAGYYLDVDNDGLKDLLVAPNSTNTAENFNGVWFYKNTGTVSIPTFIYQRDDFLQGEMIELGTGANPTFFDYDSDGLDDIVIGNYGYFNGGSSLGELSLYKNTGTISNPFFELITRDYSGASSLNANGLYPTFGDLDGDGDKDMILGDVNGILYFYTNTAGAGNTANFVLSQPNYKGIDVGQFSSPQLVDVNRDGLLDLLIGERSGNLNYYENIGTASVADFSSSATNDFFGGIDVMVPCCTGYSTPFMIEDSLNNYILYVGSEEGNLYQFDNIGGNLSGNFNLVDSLYLDGLNISVSGTDINGNGKLELIYGQWFGGVTILKNGNPNTVSIDEMEGSQIGISLFPNPSANNVFLLIDGASEGQELTVQVVNALGQLVIQRRKVDTDGEMELNTSDLSNGVYFLRIGVNGQALTKKLIIQKH
ncbi:MAG: T9SS type A sorting domain-containing protein [Fluviicola sp.]|nr:T9SS type A sorting domain-containing protein [Fluviicola sp.]